MKIVHDLIYLKQLNARKEVFTEYETTIKDGSYLDRKPLSRAFIIDANSRQFSELPEETKELLRKHR
jgi:hypothetical protein